jgi:hypothetical protein
MNDAQLDQKDISAVKSNRHYAYVKYLQVKPVEAIYRADGCWIHTKSSSVVILVSKNDCFTLK